MSPMKTTNETTFRAFVADVNSLGGAAGPDVEQAARAIQARLKGNRLMTDDWFLKMVEEARTEMVTA